MLANLVAFGADVVDLTAEPLALLLALPLALVIRGRLQAALVVLNLWLVVELAATVFDPGYRFGNLLLPRLIASALQVAMACALLAWWRRWRTDSRSVTAH